MAEAATVEQVAADLAVALGAPANDAAPEQAAGEHYPFNPDFQAKLAALAVRDGTFMAQVRHLLKPDYFEHVGDAAMVNLTIRYFDKFGKVPDHSTVVQLLKEDLSNKVIRPEHRIEVVNRYKEHRIADISDREFAVEKAVEFARNQAVSQAIYDSVDLVGKQRFDKIEELIKNAVSIGANDGGGDYNYWTTIDQRSDIRIERASGKLPPRGITTGVKQLDDLLYHRGFGRKELAAFMGGAKSTKSAGLAFFAKMASLAGHNVLAVTLELSREVWGERLDATVSDTEINQLGLKINDVREKVKALHARAGILELREYPPGSFSPADLRRLLETYKAKGVVFDLIVVDYADIMAPDHWTDNAIENSKSVWIGLRAIAMRENAAVLTATQTNRTGHTAVVAKAEHAAEDFNKIRIADLVISINANEDEIRKGEARLYFAASRNQAGDFTLIVRQQRAKMHFIASVIGVE